MKFQGNKELNQMVQEDGSLDPNKGITLEEATDWFAAIWDNYDDELSSPTTSRTKGHEWADEILKAMLVVP